MPADFRSKGLFGYRVVEAGGVWKGGSQRL